MHMVSSSKIIFAASLSPKLFLLSYQCQPCGEENVDHKVAVINLTLIVLFFCFPTQTRCYVVLNIKNLKTAKLCTFSNDNIRSNSKEILFHLSFC